MVWSPSVDRVSELSSGTFAVGYRRRSLTAYNGKHLGDVDPRNERYI